jgi:hypothetical protein
MSQELGRMQAAPCVEPVNLRRCQRQIRWMEV